MSDAEWSNTNREKAQVVEKPQEPTLVGGKPFAGALVNVFPTLWFHHKNCIAGFLGRDHIQGRGFHNSEVRTSPVQTLLVLDGDLYAITMNSAYLLVSLQLTKFLTDPFWKDQINSVMKITEENSLDD